MAFSNIACSLRPVRQSHQETTCHRWRCVKSFTRFPRPGKRAFHMTKQRDMAVSPRRVAQFTSTNAPLNDAAPVLIRRCVVPETTCPHRRAVKQDRCAGFDRHFFDLLIMRLKWGLRVAMPDLRKSRVAGVPRQSGWRWRYNGLNRDHNRHFTCAARLFFFARW